MPDRGGFMSGYRLADTEPLGTPDPGLVADSAGLFSAVVPLRGLTCIDVHRRRKANPFGPRSAAPQAISPDPVQQGDIFAAAVVLSADRRDVERARAVDLDSAAAASHTVTVVVRWDDTVVDEVHLPSALHDCIDVQGYGCDPRKTPAR